VRNKKLTNELDFISPSNCSINQAIQYSVRNLLLDLNNCAWPAK